MTGKSSHEFKIALDKYEYAKAHGFDPQLVSDLWDAVMRALHGTPPPPPVGHSGSMLESDTSPGSKIGSTTPKIIDIAAWCDGVIFDPPPGGWKEDVAHIRSRPLSIDDDFDRMMREG